MCGRYYVDIDEGELRDICAEVQKSVDERQMSFTVSTGEIFPTNIVPVGTSEGFVPMKWGFSKFDGKGNIINARSETAAILRAFEKPMQTGRCLIPASNYYECTMGFQ